MLSKTYTINGAHIRAAFDDKTGEILLHMIDCIRAGIIKDSVEVCKFCLFDGAFPAKAISRPEFDRLVLKEEIGHIVYADMEALAERFEEVAERRREVMEGILC